MEAAHLLVFPPRVLFAIKAGRPRPAKGSASRLYLFAGGLSHRVILSNTFKEAKYMASKWVKAGIDGGVGAVAGVADQVIQNWDEKRESEAHAKLSIWKQAGTWLNYGVPVLSMLMLAFMGMPGDWGTRMMTVGGQLAGRKATWQYTKRSRVVTYKAWTGDHSQEAEKRARELVGAGAGSSLDF